MTAPARPIPPLPAGPTRLDAVSLHLQLCDTENAVLWEATAQPGSSRLHANPPDELMARTSVLRLYLTQGMEHEALETYVGHLACGCSVVYPYRPALTALCPTHSDQYVRRVDYPGSTDEVPA